MFIAIYPASRVSHHQPFLNYSKICCVHMILSTALLFECLVVFQNCRHFLERHVSVLDTPLALNSAGIRTQESVGLGDTSAKPPGRGQSIELDVLDAWRCLTPAQPTLPHPRVCPPQLLRLLPHSCFLPHRYPRLFYPMHLAHSRRLAQRFCLSFSFCHYCHFFKLLAPDQVAGVGGEDAKLFGPFQALGDDTRPLATTASSLVEEQREREREREMKMIVKTPTMIAAKNSALEGWADIDK